MKKRFGRGGLGMGQCLFILLVYLKLTHQIDEWSWWWVWSPILLLMALAAITNLLGRLIKWMES